MVQLPCPQRKLKVHHEVLDQAQLQLLVFQVICLQKSLYLCCQIFFCRLQQLKSILYFLKLFKPLEGKDFMFPNAFLSCFTFNILLIFVEKLTFCFYLLTIQFSQGSANVYIFIMWESMHHIRNQVAIWEEKPLLL